MNEQLTIKRTDSNDIDFQQLVGKLDNELWDELKEDQAKYDQYNKVPGLNTVIVIYAGEKPVAIGCFKKYSDDTVEIKRMFVEKGYRGKGISKLLLKELETWAVESGYQKAILETSVYFTTARNLYMNAGYTKIENYGQYKGIDDSVCMKKELMKTLPTSAFKDAAGIEYFDFEENFVERNIRCIPMIVRFKMDKAGIKLKLAEWNKFSVEERIELATIQCGNEEEARRYYNFLVGLISKNTGKEATCLAIDQNPAWADTDKLPGMLVEKLKEFDWNISTGQWKELTNLQRFALLKLCRPGHESKNFPKAVKEFGLLSLKINSPSGAGV
ncbi:MAG: nitrate reductase associated protein [Chitinophagaceae bacterium]